MQGKSSVFLSLDKLAALVNYLEKTFSHITTHQQFPSEKKLLALSTAASYFGFSQDDSFLWHICTQ